MTTYTTGRRPLPALLVLVALLLSARAANAAADFATYLDAEGPRLLARHGVPGMSVALVRNGRLAWTRAYGFADMASGRRLEPGAVFRAESLSKPLVAWRLLQLTEAGRLALDDPLAQHLDLARFRQREHLGRLTLRQLLSHSGGLPLGDFSAQFTPGTPLPDLTSFTERELGDPPTPGGGFAYSNAGYHLLELMLQQVTGRDFGVDMQASVLTPLGMTGASFDWTALTAARMPTAYRLDGTAVSPYVYPARASGGLLATATDLGHFAAALSRPRIAGGLGPEALRTLQTVQIADPGPYASVASGYSFGFFVEILADGRTALFHGGQGNGWMSHLHAVPASGDALVILTNSQRSWPLFAELVEAWARHADLPVPALHRLRLATQAAWVTAALLATGAGLLLVVMLAGLWRRQRHLARPRGPRLLAAAAATGGAGLLAWSQAQPWLLVASVLPGAWPALASALAAAVLASLLWSACPPRAQNASIRPR